MSLKKNLKGFTLIELLVVIAIIGLLATLAVVALGNARQKSRDAKRVSDIKQISTALELRYVEQENYPAQTGANHAEASNELGIDHTCIDNSGFGTTCSSPIYMGAVPSDPSNLGDNNACVPTSAAVCNYSYYTGAATPSTTGYHIMFYLEGATGGLGAGLHCATPNGVSADENCQ